VQSWLTLELDYFEDQLRYLVSGNYQTLFLQELYDRRAQEDASDRPAVCLTLDDGYLDNWIYVFPLLRKFNVRATIFVSPEFVDERSQIRPNLEDYWAGRKALGEIEDWGYLSWDEMRAMQSTGLVDIQSHTVTHTKYPVSDRIVDFHHPGTPNIYPPANSYPNEKPYCIANPDFERLIPFGVPVFEEQSSVVASRVFINDDFVSDVVQHFHKADLQTNYDFSEALRVIRPIYDDYRARSAIVERVETKEQHVARVDAELRISKSKIEEELGKPVRFCCWPHGDNTEFAHRKALEIGYIATSAGNVPADADDVTRFDRIALSPFKANRMLSRIKTRYKLESGRGKEPFYSIRRTYELARYGSR
jgi:hypothetical protein